MPLPAGYRLRRRDGCCPKWPPAPRRAGRAPGKVCGGAVPASRAPITASARRRAAVGGCQKKIPGPLAAPPRPPPGTRRSGHGRRPVPELRPTGAPRSRAPPPPAPQVLPSARSPLRHVPSPGEMVSISTPISALSSARQPWARLGSARPDPQCRHAPPRPADWGLPGCPSAARSQCRAGAGRQGRGAARPHPQLPGGAELLCSAVWCGAMQFYAMLFSAGRAAAPPPSGTALSFKEENVRVYSVGAPVMRDRKYICLCKRLELLLADWRIVESLRLDRPPRSSVQPPFWAWGCLHCHISVALEHLQGRWAMTSLSSPLQYLTNLRRNVS